MSRKNVTYSLSPDAIQYIEELKQASGLSSNGKAIEELVQCHRTHIAAKSDSLSPLAAEIVRAMRDEFRNDMTRLRLATGYTEKNVQILIEMMASYLYAQNAEKHIHFLSTEDSNLHLYQEAQEYVSNKIARFKQKKDSKK